MPTGGGKITSEPDPRIKNFFLEIARGKVPGMAAVNKFGWATNG